MCRRKASPDRRVREQVGGETLEPSCDRRVPAVAPVRGGQADELAHELWLTQRQLQRDPAALRVAHHVGTLDLQGAQQRRGVVAELLVGHRAPRVRRAAVSLLIEDDDRAPGDEGRHPPRHRVGGQEGPGDEQQRHRIGGAQVTMNLVVELQAVDGEMSAARGRHAARVATVGRDGLPAGGGGDRPAANAVLLGPDVGGREGAPVHAGDILAQCNQALDDLEATAVDWQGPTDGLVSDSDP